MNEFESKWTSIVGAGHAAGRFRVYPDHILNFYVQYSLAGLREIAIEVLIADPPAYELPAFRNIALSTLPIVGGLRIGMTLLDADLARNFSVMCYDLAERSRVADSVDSAMGILLRALNSWAELFKKRPHEGLTKDEVLGLVGELLVVKALLVDSRADADALVRGWRGPDGDARDIGFNGTRIEVKAQRSTGALKLRISSLNQLDDRGEQVFVVLVRLSPAESGESLIELVQHVQQLIKSKPLASAEFERKIMLSGMSADADLSHESYSVDERLVYAVSDDFPRLVPGNVPQGVSAAQYEVSGPLLDASATTWEVVLGAING